MSYDDLRQAVINGDAVRAEALTREALAQGADTETILSDGLVFAMDVVGQQFSEERTDTHQICWWQLGR